MDENRASNELQNSAVILVFVFAYILSFPFKDSKGYTKKNACPYTLTAAVSITTSRDFMEQNQRHIILSHTARILMFAICRTPKREWNV